MKEPANKKYFYRIIILIFLAFAIVINLFAMSLFKVYETLMIEKIKAVRSENLKEINNMAEYLTNFVMVLSHNIEKDPAINKLLLADSSNYDKIEAMRKISSIHSMSTNIHSIWIYNPLENKVYSSIDEDTRYILHLIQSKMRTSKSKLLYQDIFEINKNLVHSYMFSMDMGSDSQGKLIINIDLGWLNQINAKHNTKLYLINKDSGKIYSIEKSTQVLDPFNSKQKTSIPIYLDQIIAHNKETNQYYIEDEMITYSALQDVSWSWVNISSREDILQYQNLISRYTISITCLFLLMTFLLSLLVSKKIIKPFNVLHGLLLDFKGKNCPAEPIYLTDTIVEILEDIKKMEIKTNLYSEKLNRELLKELILGNIKEKEARKLFSEYGFDLEWVNDCRILYCYLAVEKLKDTMISSPYIIKKLELGDDVIYLLKDVGYKDICQGPLQIRINPI